MSSITLKNGRLEVDTRYHPQLIANIKSLPPESRAWDPLRKIWLIAPEYGLSITTWIKQYLGEQIPLPKGTFSVSTKKTETYRVQYVGACKTRADGSSSAFGLVNQEWKLLFPEDVLKSYFHVGLSAPKGSLYAILGISQQSTGVEIHSSFRRVARQWHPDVCREPNAHEIFIKIQEAYAILSNPVQRTKYDVGLKLQMASNLITTIDLGYHPPFRCGIIKAVVTEGVGKTRVEEILSWDDIKDDKGRMLIVSWEMGNPIYTEAWV